MMKLTSTEKYALAVLETYGKLSSLRQRERGLCLVASCVWDMIQADVVAADEKGRLGVSAPLPETLSYCAPVYEMLAEKSRKPEKVVLEHISSLTGRRIKALVQSMADNLINKSVLVLEQQSGSRKVQLCHVNTAVIAEDIAAVKHMNGAAAQEQIMLAILLLESGTAKKLLAKEELSSLKKAAKQVTSELRNYVRNVKTIILATEIAIIIAIVTSASQV